MYRIGKVFNFEASHKLEGLPAGHQCGRHHGHSYVVEVTFVGQELSPEGWLFDFAELKALKALIDDNLDHRHLNDMLDIQPTSENLAKLIYQWVQALMADGTIANDAPEGTYLEKVSISETAKTFAEYFGV